MSWQHKEPQHQHPLYCSSKFISKKTQECSKTNHSLTIWIYNIYRLWLPAKQMFIKHMTRIECRVAGFLVGPYLIVTMSIWIPQAIWIWSWSVNLKNILKLRKYPPFSWNIFSIEMEQHGYVIYSRTRPHVFWQSFHRAASHPSHLILDIKARFLFFFVFRVHDRS